jgi:hypothetical protein
MDGIPDSLLDPLDYRGFAGTTGSRIGAAV